MGQFRARAVLQCNRMKPTSSPSSQTRTKLLTMFVMGPNSLLTHQKPLNEMGYPLKFKLVLTDQVITRTRTQKTQKTIMTPILLMISPFQKENPLHTIISLQTV